MVSLMEREFARSIRTPEDVPRLSPAGERAVLSLLRDDFAPMLHDFQWRAVTSRARETYLCAGRGSGKTYAGACAIVAAVDEGHKDLVAVSTTFQSLMQYSVKGPSGILNVPTAGERPRLMLGAVDPRLEWSNGARCLLLSAQRARGLRGANFTFGWLDEVTAWSYGREALDMLRLACRGRDDARMLLTFTPSPDTRLAADLIHGPLQPDGNRALPENVEIIRASTFENRANLGAETIKDLLRRFPEGTIRHELELAGDVVLTPTNPIATPELLERATIDAADLPVFRTVVLSVDPSRSEFATGDRAGGIIAGIGVDGRIYILADVSVAAAPTEWARHFRAAYNRYRCDLAIYESNRLSGDLVALIMTEASGSGQAWKPLTSRGKKLVRLTPALAMVEAGRVLFVDRDDPENLVHLKDELLNFDSSMPRHQRDDRLDSFSQAVNELAQML